MLSSAWRRPTPPGRQARCRAAAASVAASAAVSAASCAEGRSDAVAVSVSARRPAADGPRRLWPSAARSACGLACAASSRGPAPSRRRHAGRRPVGDYGSGGPRERRRGHARYGPGAGCGSGAGCGPGGLASSARRVSGCDGVDHASGCVGVRCVHEVGVLQVVRVHEVGVLQVVRSGVSDRSAPPGAR